jgi:hypothetical protein
VAQVVPHPPGQTPGQKYISLVPMAHGGGVHTTINGAVGVRVNVGVSKAVLVGVAVLVRLAVGVLNQPPLLLLKEMMIRPRMVARMAMIPIMALDFMWMLMKVCIYLDRDARVMLSPGQVDSWIIGSASRAG